MKKNIGKWDKAIRICLGIVIIILGAYLKSVWGVLGLIPIITAEKGTCPLYWLLGIRTNNNDAKKAH